MFMIYHLKTTLAIIAVTTASILMSVAAHAGTPQDKFYQAYYLETEQGKADEAARLYQEFITEGTGDAKIIAEARARLAACKEEMACTDLARLMPAETLLYVELREPGSQVHQLLNQLGLLAETGEVAGLANRVAISPTLVKELLGIRGFAAAVTGIDPARQMPSGVAVFHPGNVEVIRGLLETALPAATTPVEPINGFATYDIEGKALVTLTSRLVVAGTHRNHIEGVLNRISGTDGGSLLSNDAIAGNFKDRGDDVLFVCLNAKPLMPMLNGMMAAMGGQNRETAMAQALLDLNSLETVVAKAGFGDQGINVEVSLKLAEGHRNLVYNFLRMPTVPTDALNSIPAGAAAFAVMGIGDPEAMSLASAATDKNGKPIVTALDIGREVFANMISIGAFVMPAVGDAAGADCVPDIGACIKVRDPGRSEALWSEILGIASMAAGTGHSLDGLPVDIEGQRAKAFAFPENVTVYFTATKDEVLLSVTQSAMTRALAARKSGQNIFKDASFAPALARLNAATTKGLFIHPARCFDVSKRYMDADEIAEAQPWVDTMSNTLACVLLDHSGETLRVSAQLTGLPRVGGLVAQVITRERERGRLNTALRESMNRGQWNEAIDQADEIIKREPGNTDALLAKYEVMSRSGKAPEALHSVEDQLFERYQNDADGLNSLAWELVTERQYSSCCNEFALRLSERSNELTNHSNWMYLDTLAWVHFEMGNTERAVELERRAVELAKDSDRRNEAEESLAKFEAKLREQQLAENHARSS